MKSENRLVFMSRLRSMLLRAGVILITLLAWFSISNHCAIGALGSQATVTMHGACHESSPPPAESPGKGEQSPCCKILRATLVKLSTPWPASDLAAFSLQTYFTTLVVFPELLHSPTPLESDTGPPFCGSFAESVLQRSILAHAPPLFLS